MNEPKPSVTRREADAVAEIVRKAFAPQVVELKAPVNGDDSVTVEHVLLVPQGLEVKSVKKLLDEYRERPERRTGTAVMTELQSFVDHVVRFKDADSVVFADRRPSNPSLLAVLDYHRAGAEGAPRFGVHRASYGFPVSDEWQAWTASSGKWLTQEQFARFLEDRIADVADPAAALDGAKAFLALLMCEFASPQRLIELSRGLLVHVGAKVQTHQNLSSGEASIAFAVQHTDERGAPLKVPGAFLLRIPVFREGATYQIPARLRYRVKDAEVAWAYELYRAPAAFDDAMGDAIDIVHEGTGLPVWSGRPEAG